VAGKIAAAVRSGDNVDPRIGVGGMNDESYRVGNGANPGLTVGKIAPRPQPVENGRKRPGGLPISISTGDFAHPAAVVG